MLARLKAFAQGGGKVLFLGGTPQSTAARIFRHARPVTAQDSAWATVVNDPLPPTPTPPQYPPAAPPQPQAVPSAVLRALHSVVRDPTVTLDTPDSALRVMHRGWGDADVYLILQ